MSSGEEISKKTRMAAATMAALGRLGRAATTKMTATGITKMFTGCSWSRQASEPAATTIHTAELRFQLVRDQRKSNTKNGVRVGFQGRREYSTMRNDAAITAQAPSAAYGPVATRRYRNKRATAATPKRPTRTVGPTADPPLTASAGAIR